MGNFAVVNRDGMRAGKLSAVVMHQPERKVNRSKTSCCAVCITSAGPQS